METVQFGFRLPPHLVRRLEQYASSMRARTPGLAFTRSDAVRVLLLAALDAAEKTTTTTEESHG